MSREYGSCEFFKLSFQPSKLTFQRLKTTFQSFRLESFSCCGRMKAKGEML